MTSTCQLHSRPQHSSVYCPVASAAVAHSAVTLPLHRYVVTIPVTLDLFSLLICGQDVPVAYPVVLVSSQHTSVSRTVTGVTVSLLLITHNSLEPIAVALEPIPLRICIQHVFVTHLMVSGYSHHISASSYVV